MSSHFRWDLVFWAVFVAGQMMFLLKRADLARRSPLNGVKSIGAYFSRNWVIIIQRIAFEGVFLYLYRHPDTPAQFGLHFSLPQTKQSLMLVFFGGYFADAGLDWITMQDSICGIKIPVWMKESIPQLPEVQTLVEKLEVTSPKP